MSEHQDIEGQRARIRRLREDMADEPDIRAAVHKLESMLGEVIIEQGARVRKLRTGRAGKSRIAKAVDRLEALKAEFLTETGREWSEVREEGPILLTSNKVRGSEVLPELKEMTKDFRKRNIVSADARVLVVTGTHGHPESGRSGLTDRSLLEHSYYKEDCRRVGVKAGPSRLRVLPVSPWDNLPTINKPAEKIEPPPPGSFYEDEELKGMDFRMANMSYYYERQKKLIDDINEFKPDIIMLAFCYSVNSDVSMLLRRCGLFSIMVLSHDIKILTKNPKAELNAIQRNLLIQIANIDPEINVYLWGGSGTGKTIVALEIVKTKLSHFKTENKKVKVIVTSFLHASDDTPLIEYMKNQLRNIEEVSVLPLYQFCKNLGVDYDWKHPKKMINNIIRSLRTNSDQRFLLVCDEIFACRSEGQKTTNWTDLETAENVTWVLAIRPDSSGVDMKNLNPPSGPSIISKKLLHSHRNCYLIREFKTCFQSHFWKKAHIPMDDEQMLPADQLPPDTIPPLWVDVPAEGNSQKDILEKISQLPEMSKLTTTVIYNDKDEGAEEFCYMKEWGYRDLNDMAGSEDECVIVLDCLQPESISRARNLLVVVTTSGHKNYDRNTARLKSLLLHMTENFKCQIVSDCLHSGQKSLLEKRRFPEVTKTDEDYDPFTAVPFSRKRLTLTEKRRYDAKFDKLGPLAGRLSGKKVREGLKWFELPDSTMDRILKLSHHDKDGLLDRYQFRVAYHLTFRAMKFGDHIPDQESRVNIQPQEKGETQILLNSIKKQKLLEVAKERHNHPHETKKIEKLPEMTTERHNYQWEHTKNCLSVLACLSNSEKLDVFTQETPYSASTKFDGTNIAKDDEGVLYSRRFVMDKEAIKFQHTSFEEVLTSDAEAYYITCKEFYQNISKFYQHQRQTEEKKKLKVLLGKTCKIPRVVSRPMNSVWSSKIRRGGVQSPSQHHRRRGARSKE